MGSTKFMWCLYDLVRSTWIFNRLEMVCWKLCSLSNKRKWSKPQAKDKGWRVRPSC